MLKCQNLLVKNLLVLLSSGGISACSVYMWDNAAVFWIFFFFFLNMAFKCDVCGKIIQDSVA